MILAIKEKDVKEFQNQSQRFLSMIRIQDTLMAEVPYFRLDYWLLKGDKFGRNKHDKQQAIRNLKMQYTIWGHSDNPNTSLHDYAHKEWNGLLGTLYYKRWKLFVERELKILQGLSAEEINYFEIEKAWINDKAITSETSLSKREMNKLIKKILN